MSNLSIREIAAGIKERTLGRTGLRVKMLGVGGISSQDVFEKALEYGLNFFDVHGYDAGHGLDGRIRFRNALKKTGVKREDLILTARCDSFTYEGAMQQLDKCLELLGTDYLDLYGPYNVTQSVDRVKQTMSLGGCMEAFNRAKSDGKIRHIGGVSGHHHNELVSLLKTNAFDAVMVAVNIFDQDVIDTVLPVAREMNIGTIAMKPFAKGIFTESAEVALQYVFSQNVSVAIPGMMTVRELEENIRVTSAFREMSAEALYALKEKADTIVATEGKNICRQCGYCVPVCPQHLDIKKIFYMERQASRYYNETWARSEYAKISPRADECIECGECEKECPYDLPIREMLKKIHIDLGGNCKS